MYKKLASLMLMFSIVLLASCNGDGDEKGEKKIKVAFVTNCIADFWIYGQQGALDAGEELGIDVEVSMPPEQGGLTSNQKRILEQMLNKGVDGIAVSPSNPANQSSILNQLGEKCAFITHDSDAPDSNRRLYIGISNYDGGRDVGKLVKKAIPDGGDVMLFIGSIDQDNGRLRRQGVIDELLDRSHDPTRYDAPGSVIKGDNYTILDTKVDGNDETRKKEMPEQALAKNPDIDCMVGLFEYNPPKILQALKSAGKLGQIKVVGFDEAFETLDAIADGNCVGTVVQNPYEYGYRSVKILHDMITGKNDYKGETYIEIPLRIIDTKEKATEYKAELKSMLEKSKK